MTSRHCLWKEMKSTWLPEEEKELGERMKRCLNIDVKAFWFLSCPRVCVVKHFFDFTEEKVIVLERAIYLRCKSRGKTILFPPATRAFGCTHSSWLCLCTSCWFFLLKGLLTFLYFPLITSTWPLGMSLNIPPSEQSFLILQDWVSFSLKQGLPPSPVCNSPS